MSYPARHNNTLRGWKSLLPAPLSLSVWDQVGSRPSGRCLSFSITHRQVSDIISGFPLVTQVTVFDVYSGKQVPPGKKSLAYRITFQSPKHTLTDEEVNRIQQQILDGLSKKLGATLRG